MAHALELWQREGKRYRVRIKDGTGSLVDPTPNKFIFMLKASEDDPDNKAKITKATANMTYTLPNVDPLQPDVDYTGADDQVQIVTLQTARGPEKVVEFRLKSSDTASLAPGTYYAALDMIPVADPEDRIPAVWSGEILIWKTRIKTA